MKSCAFTGNRPSKIAFAKDEESEEFKKFYQILKNEILTLINRKIKVFYTGMSMGVDLWCAEIVIELKKENPKLKLIGVLPFYNQCDTFSDDWKERHKTVFDNLDMCSCITIKEDKNSMRIRNQYMVDNADILLAVHSGNNVRSGTFMTKNIAIKKGIEVVEINPLEVIRK